MKKKRVKIFIDGEVLVHAHFSGIGHYTADLLHAIDKLLYENEYSKFSVTIGVPFRVKHKLIKYGFENIGVRGIPFLARTINGFKKRGLLPPIDLLFGKQIYIFPNYSSWPTFRSKSMPIIYDLSFVYHGEFVEPQNRTFLVEQVQLSAKRAKRIITISRNSEKEIVEYYKCHPQHIVIAYPAADINKFYRRSKEEIIDVKARYGIFDNYILFVGNIEPRKNLITLLKAYRQLDPELQKKYSLLLIGAKGWLDNEINREIVSMRKEGLRVIQPVDYVVDEDLPALYSGAKAFVYVSRYEGFGIPPIEAMACGTPVIASNNSSLPEAVGDAAITVDAMDDKQLTNSLEKLLTSKKLAEELVGKGYDQVMKFDWVESARNVLKAAEEMS
jgi:alpha-1,3-rhamnosyl/mannosyltransferase